MGSRALGAAAAFLAAALGAGAARGGEAPGAERGKTDARALERIAALEQLLERREKQIDRMHKIVLAQQKALETIKALDKAQVELARLKKENLRLKHDLHQYSRTIRQLVDQGVPVREIVSAGEATPPKPINAKVTAVRPEVMLSAGSDDGVKKGYRFTIYRDERYIGKVEVTKVFADTSAAKVLPDWTKEEVKEGDEAATSIQQQPPRDLPDKMLDETTAEKLFRDGVDLFEMRRYPEAAHLLRKALELAPDAEEIRRSLRMAEDAHIRRDDRDRAHRIALPGAPVLGKVLAVRPEVNLVMLSVGSDDGVKRGCRFTITRGERRIGTVEVEKVFTDMSSARIIDVWKDPIKEGDDAALGLGGRIELRAPPGDAAPPAEKPVPPGERGEVF
jgi:tetratricopeptide (TPR) repeat protein